MCCRSLARRCAAVVASNLFLEGGRTSMSSVVWSQGVWSFSRLFALSWRFILPWVFLRCCIIFCTESVLTSVMVVAVNFQLCCRSCFLD